MKAIIINRYGDLTNYKIEEVNTPLPNDDEILIEVKAFTLDPLATKIRSGIMKFIAKRKFPMILGSDFSGIIRSVGKNIKNFSIGDEVMGYVDPFKMNGPFAEFVITKTDQLILKPKLLSHPEAASISIAAMSSLQSLRDITKLKVGQSILILGAAGALGHLAVQIAKNIGTEITAVCRTENNDFVKSCGATFCIDYGKENVFKNQNKYDVIFDAVNKYEFKDAKYALKKGGVYVNTMPSLMIMLRSITNVFRNKKAKVLFLKTNLNDLTLIKEWSENGSIKVHMDRVYSGLESIYEATEYLETGHVRGKIAIEVG